MTPDYYDEAVQIVKTENVGLIRQIVHLASQDLFIPVLDRMANLQRAGKFTGRTVIHWNQGGIKKIETEQETK